jgi:exodeoxyribonuclease V alpha subunit
MGAPPWPWIDPDKAIPWIEQRSGLVLAESQRSAVAPALASKVLVITGGPGVGKTTLVNAMPSCASSQQRAPSFYCALPPAALRSA